MGSKSKLKLIGGILLVIVILVAAFAGMSLIEKKFGEKEVASSSTSSSDGQESHGSFKFDGKKYRYTDDIDTYLFMGTDFSGNEDATGDAYQGSMADFLLVVAVDNTDKSYSMLQIDRDTMTEMNLIDENGVSSEKYTQQLCCAHWYGVDKKQSAENQLDAVENFLGGLDIDGYYCISMSHIPEMNHVVGGVELELLEDFTKFDSSMVKGKTITLSDEQAQIYVHNRYDVGDETNESRMQRQKQYMQAYFEKVKSLSKDNPALINDVYKQFQDYSTTDMSGSEVSGIMNNIYQYTSNGISQLEGEHAIGKLLSDDVEHVQFYPDEQNLIDTMCKMYHISNDVID